MKILYVLGALVALFVSCSERRLVNALPETKVQTEHYDFVYDHRKINDSVVQVEPMDGKAEISLYKEKEQTVYIEFDPEGYKSVNAEIISEDSSANLRFSQIFLPDGTTDGPFSDSVKYEIDEQGDYIFSIHENMMAGDPWSGNFTVKIDLK